MLRRVGLCQLNVCFTVLPTAPARSTAWRPHALATASHGCRLPFASEQEDLELLRQFAETDSIVYRGQQLTAA